LLRFHNGAKTGMINKSTDFEYFMFLCDITDWGVTPHIGENNYTKSQLLQLNKKCVWYADQLSGIFYLFF